MGVRRAVGEELQSDSRVGDLEPIEEGGGHQKKAWVEGNLCQEEGGKGGVVIRNVTVLLLDGRCLGDWRWGGGELAFSPSIGERSTTETLVATDPRQPGATREGRDRLEVLIKSLCGEPLSAGNGQSSARGKGLVFLDRNVVIDLLRKPPIWETPHLMAGVSSRFLGCGKLLLYLRTGRGGRSRYTKPHREKKAKLKGKEAGWTQKDS